MNDHSKTSGCGSHGGQDQQPRASVLNPNTEASAQTTLRVAGMDCADEVETVERALKPLSGVRDVRVNLMGGKVVVAHHRSVTAEQLIQAIASAGLSATPDQADATDAPADAQRSRLVSVAASALFTGAGLALQWTHLGPPVGGRN